MISNITVAVSLCHAKVRSENVWINWRGRISPPCRRLACLFHTELFDILFWRVLTSENRIDMAKLMTRRTEPGYKQESRTTKHVIIFHHRNLFPLKSLPLSSSSLVAPPSPFFHRLLTLRYLSGNTSRSIVINSFHLGRHRRHHRVARTE